MSDVPKFALKRLQDGAAGETHPDADLLTGFLEKSLLEPERIRVMDHLASCTACREVVACALPELPELPELEDLALTISRSARRRSWFNSAVLRWVVATAGIVAVASVGVLQHRSRQNKIADDNILFSRNATPPPVTPGVQALLVPSQPLPIPPEAKNSPPAVARSRAQPTRPESMAIDGSTRSSIQSLRTPRGGQAASGRGVGVASGSAGRQSSVAPEPAPITSSAMQPTAPSSSQAVEVESQAATTATNTENEVADKLTKESKNRSLKNQSSMDSAVVAAPPRWSISADGDLQRSSDAGHTWTIVNPGAAFNGSTGALSARNHAFKKSSETAAAAPRKSNSGFRAATAFGTDVWAGGSASMLYHSSDSGAHWTSVVPSASGTTLTGDIASIEFSDPQHGAVTTSNGEVWHTTDAGQTWHRP